MNTNFKPELSGSDMPDERQYRKKRPALLMLGGLALVLLLGSAAFMAGKYMNRRAASGGGPLAFQGGPGIVAAGGGAPGASVGAQVSRRLEFQHSEELPQNSPDVNGVFVRREDNSFFIGTGDLTVAITGDQGGGSAETNMDYDGPLVEVVVTNETQVYKDDTLSGMDEPPAGDVLQQKVAPGSIEEIGQNSALTVWGRKAGDRLIAEVLLYSSPMFFSAPGG